MWRSKDQRGLTGSRGFSLLEMVIACLLFTTVAISLLGVFNHHYRAVSKARLRLLAQHLCRSKMLDYTAARYEGVDAFIPNPGPSLIETIPVQFEIRGMVRNIDFEVWAERKVATAGLGGEKIIAVWVYWEEGRTTRSVVYRTLLAKSGSDP